MARKKEVDDLEDELEEKEEEDGEEEGEDTEGEEAEEDEDAGENEPEDEDEDEDKQKKVAKGKVNGKAKTKGRLIGIVLRDGIPKRVQIVKVMGRNVKATKVGEKDESKALRIPISDVFEYDEAVYDKMMIRAEKIIRLKEANVSDATNRLKSIAAPRSMVRRGDPMRDW